MIFSWLASSQTSKVAEIQTSHLPYKILFIICSQITLSSDFIPLNCLRGYLQDGGGVRHGDHLPPYKYNKNTSTCEATPTEHLLNAGRRPLTSPKARNSPHNWVGQRKKEKLETKE